MTTPAALMFSDHASAYRVNITVSVQERNFEKKLGENVA